MSRVSSAFAAWLTGNQVQVPVGFLGRFLREFAPVDRWVGWPSSFMSFPPAGLRFQSGGLARAIATKINPIRVTNDLYGESSRAKLELCASDISVVPVPHSLPTAQSNALTGERKKRIRERLQPSPMALTP